MTSRIALIGASLALVLAACGGSADPDRVSSEGTTSSSTTTTVATATEGGTEGGSGGASGSAGAGASPTTVAASNQGGGTAPSAAGAAQPSRAGTYTYDTDGESTTTGGLGGTETLPTRTTLKVDPASGNRQTSVRDMRAADGDGSVATSTLQYRDDGVYLEHLKIQARTSGVTITYEFRPSPAQLLTPTGAGVGYHTEFTLTSTNGGLTTTTTVDVLKEETLNIGGVSVRTFLVKTATEVSGDASGTTVSNDNISPERSLTVREDSVSDLQTPFGKTHTEQVSVLRSLDPS